ncbi:voltage-dependent anion-selective channel-like protein [Leptotrombidium deliense]|uniref:Voltage-dependent anion-selective channel-like protein n=1 Tax=Leptotrombidium deliense TaxID=299467 RepID=A0A443STI0_9ACAR|nr:voltage-dependent anion-selective channel-like protein [Leptotrombidium deliense]
MSPPCFADLGKQAKDLFSKNYHLGIVKLDLKTKTDKGVEFTVNGTSNNDTGRVNATLETKYGVKEHGLTLKEKWTTDNTLTTELTLEDKIMKGLKVGFNGSFAPQSGKKTGTVKTAMKQEFFHANTDVDIDYAGVLVHGAVVLGYQGWLAGAQLSFEPSKHQLTKTNFAIGYQTPEFVLTTSSLYQKVNGQLETGIQMGWSSSNNTPRFGLGCVYKFDDATSLRGKLNNQSQIGLGFTHRLRKGINLTLCALIDGKNFNQGGHKLGIGFDLEA